MRAAGSREVPNTPEMVACAERALAAADHDDPESAIRALVRAGVDAHRIAPELHKVLIEQVPRVGRLAEVMDTSRKITALLERYLARHRARLKVKDVRLAAFVVETVVEALTHRAVIDRPELAGTARLEKETSALLAGYLFARPSRPRRLASASRAGALSSTRSRGVAR